MKKHPDKHIQAAIEYALAAGWVQIPSGHSAHCFCKLRCGDPHDRHRDHHLSIWSTPKVPRYHAQLIFKSVDRCLQIKKQ